MPAGRSGNDLISTFTSQSCSLVKSNASSNVGIGTDPERNPSTWAGSIRSSVPNSRAERGPPASATNQEPASRDLASSKSKSETRNPARPRGSPAKRMATSVVRSSDSSWITTGASSRVKWTSSSQASAPASRPRRAASRVFSGAWNESPRWAMIRGLSRGESRSVRKRFSGRAMVDPLTHGAIPMVLDETAGGIRARRGCRSAATEDDRAANRSRRR